MTSPDRTSKFESIGACIEQFGRKLGDTGIDYYEVENLVAAVAYGIGSEHADADKRTINRLTEVFRKRTSGPGNDMWIPYGKWLRHVAGQKKQDFLNLLTNLEQRGSVNRDGLVSEFAARNWLEKNALDCIAPVDEATDSCLKEALHGFGLEWNGIYYSKNLRYVFLAKSRTQYAQFDTDMMAMFRFSCFAEQMFGEVKEFTKQIDHEGEKAVKNYSTFQKSKDLSLIREKIKIICASDKKLNNLNLLLKSDYRISRAQCKELFGKMLVDKQLSLNQVSELILGVGGKKVDDQPDAAQSTLNGDSVVECTDNACDIIGDDESDASQSTPNGDSVGSIIVDDVTAGVNEVQIQTIVDLDLPSKNDDLALAPSSENGAHSLTEASCVVKQLLADAKSDSETGLLAVAVDHAITGGGPMTGGGNPRGKQDHEILGKPQKTQQKNLTGNDAQNGGLPQESCCRLRWEFLAIPLALLLVLLSVFGILKKRQLTRVEINEETDTSDSDTSSESSSDEELKRL